MTRHVLVVILLLVTVVARAANADEWLERIMMLWPSRDFGALRVQINEALTVYKSALSLSPNDAASHNAIGTLYLRLKEDDRAVSEFQQAIRLNPELPEPYYHLAQYYARKGRADEAQKFSAAFARKAALTKKTPGQYAYVRARE